MKKAKIPFAVRVTQAAFHTDTRLGHDLICDLAEDLAPGFTEASERRIEACVFGRQDENQRAYEGGIRLMLGMRKWMFVHVFILWIGVKIVESHDPCFKGEIQ